MRRRWAFAHGVAVDYVFPYVGSAYCLAFLPGVILALTGNFRSSAR